MPLKAALRTPWNVIRPNTLPNGRFPPWPRMYDPEGPLDSSKMSDTTQYEKTSSGGVLPWFLSENSLTPLRMKAAFTWLSMLSFASPGLPPWPEYAEFHSVLNDFTVAVVKP